MTRALAATAAVFATAAFVIAVAAYHRASERPSVGVLSEASIRHLWHAAAHERLTREDVRVYIGNPASIYRDNPRAECWAYSAPGGGSGTEPPYQIQMCFGPKRHLAWLAYSGPKHLGPPA